MIAVIIFGVSTIDWIWSGWVSIPFKNGFQREFTTFGLFVPLRELLLTFALQIYTLSLQPCNSSLLQNFLGADFEIEHNKRARGQRAEVPMWMVISSRNRRGVHLSNSGTCDASARFQSKIFSMFYSDIFNLVRNINHQRF